MLDCLLDSLIAVGTIMMIGGLFGIGGLIAEKFVKDDEDTK